MSGSLDDKKTLQVTIRDRDAREHMVHLISPDNQRDTPLWKALPHVLYVATCSGTLIEIRIALDTTHLRSCT